MVGDKISESQKAFWNSLSKEDRTARAKKSVEKFEKWWGSLTKNQILDLIADQKTELELLKEFKKEQKTSGKTANKETHKESGTISSPHTKVGSNALSQDELFIIWASNNLKLYIENLSEAEKDTLHVKRMQRLAARWANMSPEERTDYISKMKSGSEPLRYTMIDAWNHSSDLIRDLSIHLKENQIFPPLFSNKILNPRPSLNVSLKRATRWAALFGMFVLYVNHCMFIVTGRQSAA